MQEGRERADVCEYRGEKKITKLLFGATQAETKEQRVQQMGCTFIQHTEHRTVLSALTKPWVQGYLLSHSFARLGEVNESKVTNEKDCIVQKHTLRPTFKKSAILGHEATCAFFDCRNSVSLLLTLLIT